MPRNSRRRPTPRAASNARMNSGNAELARELAPGGRIRAAINLGNPVLAQRGADGELTGISVKLAHELAQRLDLPLELVAFNAAGKVVSALREDAWDVAFLAIDPARAEAVDFTAPYVIIEGGCLVAKSSPLQHVEEVDRDGARIAVATGSAYDLFLTRTLRHATLVRHGSGEAALAAFRAGSLDVLAGVKSPLHRVADRDPRVRVLSGAFMQIEQAMGIPGGRPAALAFLSAFVEDVKASGFVADALDRTCQTDARVAPAASSRPRA